MSARDWAAKLPRRAWRMAASGVGHAADGLAWLRARRLFQHSGLFAALPLTGRVLAIEGGHGHLAEAAVHHIPNRRCVVVDSGRQRRGRVDHRVRRRKFHRVCAAPDALPFADGAFDAAWSTVALGRLAPGVQERAVAEMARVVRAGGALVAIERVAPTVIGRRQAGRAAAAWRAALGRHGWQIEAERVVKNTVGRPNYRTVVCRRF